MILIHMMHERSCDRVTTTFAKLIFFFLVKSKLIFTTTIPNVFRVLKCMACGACMLMPLLASRSRICITWDCVSQKSFSSWPMHAINTMCSKGNENHISNPVRVFNFILHDIILLFSYIYLFIYIVKPSLPLILIDVGNLLKHLKFSCSHRVVIELLLSFLLLVWIFLMLL